MLTKFEAIFLETVLRQFSNLRLMPMGFYSGTQTLRSVNAETFKYRSGFAIVSVVYHVFYIIFTLTRMPLQNQTDLILSFFLMLASFSSNAMVLTIWMYSIEIVQLYNNIFGVNRDLQMRTFGMDPASGRGIRKKFRENLFVIVVLSTMAAPICIMIQTLVTNWHAFDSPVTLFLFTAFTVVADASMFNAFPVISAILIASTFTALFWLEKACIVWPNEIKATFRNHLDSYKSNCFSVYNTVRILNDLQNQAFGSLFTPVMKLCCIWAFLITAYCAIKLGTTMGPLLFAFFLLYFFAILVIIVPGALLMSQVYNISSKFPGKIQNSSGFSTNQESKLVAKLLKATPSLKCKIGEFYYMESKAKLTLVDNITRGISFMLVSFK